MPSVQDETGLGRMASIIDGLPVPPGPDETGCSEFRKVLGGRRLGQSGELAQRPDVHFAFPDGMNDGEPVLVAQCGEEVCPGREVADRGIFH